MLAVLKGYDDFLVDWAFTELRTIPRRQKDKNKLAELLWNSFPSHEGHRVFVRVAVKTTMPGQRQLFFLYRNVWPLVKDLRPADDMPLT